MGDVYWGVHLPLAAGVRAMGVRKSIETGTYFGAGALQLAALFDEVISIDASASVIEYCRDVYGPLVPVVRFLHGDSGTLLAELLHDAPEPTLIVLDAHWFPGASADLSTITQCPLAGELAAIRGARIAAAGSVVFVDDADMLLRSLPAPFHDEEFPTIISVVDELRSSGFQYVSVCDDVILAGPPGLGEVERRYLAARRHLGKPGCKTVPTA
jgi:hypothetical protein